MRLCPISQKSVQLFTISAAVVRTWGPELGAADILGALNPPDALSVPSCWLVTVLEYTQTVYILVIVLELDKKKCLKVSTVKCTYKKLIGTMKICSL